MDQVKAEALQIDQKYSFEEFRLMYESTERVSDRKINFTRNNITLCLAIIAGIGVSMSWAYGKKDLALQLPISMFLISTLSVIFCIYWNGQLKAFKDLNTAKFAVLEQIAERVTFPDYKDLSVRSINPFQLEYQILRRNEKLTLQNGSFLFTSNLTESFVPKAFIIFFVTTCVFCAYRFFIALNLPQT